MCKKHPIRQNHGFTLVELAIVLVIIGLLAGGVVGGASLINAAKMQSVIGDLKRYQQAVANFKDKYKYLPGDFPNASTTWSGAIDGTGDGIIGDYRNTVLGPGTTSEVPGVWQHLALAQLIEGSYTVDVTGVVTPGVNAPASRFRTNAYMMFYAMPIVLSVSYGCNCFASSYGNVIVVGEPGYPTIDPGFTPHEAQAIDQKMDDGNPTLGGVMSYPPTATGHTYCTTDNGPGGEYSNNSTLACSLIFLTGD